MPEMLADNLKSVTERIAKCCENIGRPADDVRLVAVTKQASVDMIEGVIRAGVKYIGENRVQDALAKHRIIGDKAEWHLIGHLQTNKARDAVRAFSLIHSVDSGKLASCIDKEAAKMGKQQRVLIQVNASGEESKFGIRPEEASELLKEAARYRNIKIEGLMTIAPEVDDTETVRPYFRALKYLMDETRPLMDSLGAGSGYNTLSMGMTNDFEVAIEEGSNLVRIGRAIFSD